MNLDREGRAMLVDSAREWFAGTCPVTEFRARRDRDGRVSGREHWPAMVGLGWSGLLVPEAQGGSELGLGEMAIVLEQAGRNLAQSPLLSTALIAVRALGLARQNDFTGECLRAIAAGELTVALAVDEGRHHRPDTIACSARRQEGSWRLNGRKCGVANLGAEAYLVSARCEDGSTGLFWVPAASVEIRPLSLIDCGDHGEIELVDVQLGAEALLGNDRLLERVLDAARIGLSAEMLGSAWAVFELTVEYLKIREQFGQVIGSFQGLQHRAATLYVELELARSVLEAALRAADAGSPEMPALASKVKALVGETLQHVSNEAIQLHGGIGMTDEHDSGLYLKRARVTAQLYGSAAFHRDRFARLRGF
ncbi:MAG: acyl-CoA dehydrogenase family protein [Parahaliea sp.]